VVCSIQQTLNITSYSFFLASALPSPASLRSSAEEAAMLASHCSTHAGSAAEAHCFSLKHGAPSPPTTPFQTSATDCAVPGFLLNSRITCGSTAGIYFRNTRTTRLGGGFVCT